MYMIGCYNVIEAIQFSYVGTLKSGGLQNKNTVRSTYIRAFSSKKQSGPAKLTLGPLSLLLVAS